MEEQEKAIDLSGAPVFVTGACGFIGGALTRELSKRGAKLRILVHENDKETAKNFHYEKIYADIRDQRCMREAMKGINYVFHVAGDYRLWSPNPEELLDININGTATVVEEAMNAGVARLIYTSSASTIRQSAQGLCDERDLMKPDEAFGYYTKSKIKAEQIIRGLIETKGLPAIIVKPTTVIGPGDRRPTPTGQIIYNAALSKVPAYVDTNLNIVHVYDVVDGHIAALEKGKVGEDYILGGDNVSFLEILTHVSQSVGRSPPNLKINPKWLLPFAKINETACRYLNRTPFMTVTGLKLAQSGLVYNCEKARVLFKYKKSSFGETIDDAVTWFLSRKIS